MKIGVDYYPEHWDQSMWTRDAKAMKEAGIGIVRLAEFAWSHFEPEEGKFTFTWLDKAISTLAAEGIKIVLGTPTATPTNWLVEKCPDVLPIDDKLHPMHPGVRCHRCYNSPSLRHYASLAIEELTHRYGTNPAVIGWQTDNELAANNCHCENCTKAFRKWLQRHYDSLEALNREWGTVVWSGEYSAWTEIHTPLGGSPHQNPSFLLDFSRFCSDSVADFNRFQAELIRKNVKDQFVTHNLWGYPVVTDYYDLFAGMDFTSVDYYPSTDLKSDAKANIYHGALTLDMARGVKRKNFWVMEQLSGTPGCWHPMSRTPFPGMIRAHAWQSVSRGADAVVFFRWRTARIGAEQFWHGLIDHHGEPGRRFGEFRKFSSEAAKLSPLIDGTEVKCDAALLFSHEQANALAIQPQSDGFDYLLNFKQLHRAFLRKGIGTDVIDWRADISGYRLVVAPFLFLEDEAVVEKLKRFVEAGGTLVLTTRTGVKNLRNVCLPNRLPGLLSGIAGVEVDEYDPVGHDAQKVVLFGKDAVNCTQWCDLLTPVTAETIGRYDSDFFSGRSAVTVNSFGKGSVYYLGTILDDAGYASVIGHISGKLEIGLSESLPEGVEMSVRQDGEKRLIFVLNTSKEQKHIALNPATRQCAFTGAPAESAFTLEPGDVSILLEAL